MDLLLVRARYERLRDDSRYRQGTAPPVPQSVSNNQLPHCRRPERSVSEANPCAHSIFPHCASQAMVLSPFDRGLGN